MYLQSEVTESEKAKKINLLNLEVRKKKLKSVKNFSYEFIITSV